MLVAEILKEEMKEARGKGRLFSLPPSSWGKGRRGGRGKSLLILWLCPDVQEIAISCKGIAAVMGCLVEVMV